MKTIPPEALAAALAACDQAEALPKRTAVAIPIPLSPTGSTEFVTPKPTPALLALIAVCPYPEAVAMVLLDESSVRYAAHAHGLTQAQLQAAVSKVKCAARNAAKNWQPVPGQCRYQRH